MKAKTLSAVVGFLTLVISRSKFCFSNIFTLMLKSHSMNKGIRVLAIAYLLTFISFASKAEVKAGSCSAKDVQLLDGYAKFLQEKINTTLKAKNPIQVTRKDGRFILTGTVDGQNDKSQIDKICADFTPSMDATVCQSQIRILVDEDGKKKRTGHEAYEGSPFLPDGSVNPVFVPPGYQ